MSVWLFAVAGTAIAALPVFLIYKFIHSLTFSRESNTFQDEGEDLTESEKDSQNSLLKEEWDKLYDATQELKKSYISLKNLQKQTGSQDIATAADQINDLGKSISKMTRQANEKASNNKKIEFCSKYTRILEEINPYLTESFYADRILDMGVKEKYRTPEKDVKRLQDTIDTIIQSIHKDTVSFSDEETMDFNMQMSIANSLVGEEDSDFIELMDNEEDEDETLTTSQNTTHM